MKGRILVLVLGVGFLLQGCSLQKRSLMPGWHVERIAHTKASLSSQVAENHTDEPVELTEQTVQLISSLKESPVPNIDLRKGTPVIESAPERKVTETMQSEVRLEHQQVEGVVPNLGSASSAEPPAGEIDKKRKRSLVTIAALLGVAAIVAFDLIATPTIGLIIMALALTALRFAFPYAGSESSEQRSVRADGIGKRIAMGIIGSVLGLASIPAFALGFLDLSTLPIALLGLLLVYLSLRAFMIAFPYSFPRLRARWVNAAKAQAQARKQRERERSDEPSRDWLWLLALIPLALLILAVSSFSFPAFGM